jgi:RIP metalloprotease RseP
MLLKSKLPSKETPTEIPTLQQQGVGVLQSQATNLSFNRYSLLALSEISIRTYFTIDNGYNLNSYDITLSSTTDSEMSYKTGYNDYGYFVEVYGIESANIDALFTITLTFKGDSKTTTITYSRNGQTSTIEITPEISDREGTKVAMLGIEPEYKKSLLTSPEYSISKTKEAFVSIFETFKMLFVTKEAGINDLSGPVGIYTMTSTIATYGLTSLLIWIGFLSVNIGVMNILPLPALDGGRILFVLIEAIIGRPVDRRIEGYIHTVGLLLFFGFFVYVTFHDIIRLITA